MERGVECFGEKISLSTARARFSMTLLAVNMTAGVNAQTHVITRTDSNNPIYRGRASPLNAAL